MDIIMQLKEIDKEKYKKIKNLKNEIEIMKKIKQKIVLI